MRVAIVGGSGLLGRTLYRRLKTEGKHSVRVLDVQRHDDIEAKDYTSFDVTTDDGLAGLLDGYDAVFYKTGLMGPADSFESPLRFHALNLEGALRILGEARRAGVGQLVYDSTECVFGRENRAPFGEDDRPLPDSVYGATKAAAEHYLRHAAANGDLAVTILRYPRVIAADNATIFTALRERILAGDEVRLTARGAKRFDLVHIDDVTDWNAALVGRRETQILHVAGGFTVTAVEVLRGLSGILTGDPDYDRVAVTDECTWNDRLNPDPMQLDNRASLERTGFAIRHDRLESFLQLFRR